MVNGSFGIRQTVDNLFRCVGANLITGLPPIDGVTSRVAQSIARALSLDIYRADTMFPMKHPPTQPPAGLDIFHEDESPNLFHTIVILLALGAIAVRWRQPAPAVRRIYWTAWLAGVVVFAAVLRWGFWSTRYHLPAFALAAPIVATAWPHRWSHSKKAVALYRSSWA
jgi:hypothetical protein